MLVACVPSALCIASKPSITVSTCKLQFSYQSYNRLEILNDCGRCQNWP